MNTEISYKKISSEKFDSILLEDQILENIIKPGVTIEIEDMWKIKEANMKLIADKKYCILVTSHYLADISKEARELAAGIDFQMNTLAKALLVETTGHRIVGNFYIKVNKPAIKTKIFSDRNKAMEWLRKQLTI